MYKIFYNNDSQKNDTGLEVVRVMVFSATFGNISVISRRSVLLVEKTGVPQRKLDLKESLVLYITKLTLK
jgi:ribulose-5-phosphate 4-epimerase/fuculose-1-phosphate aldolase